MTEEKLLALWGKTDKEDPGRYHPLLFHLLDVANVAHIMCEECLTTALREQMAHGLGLTISGAGVAIPYLAGLHDLGKASPGFQGQVSVLAQRLCHYGLGVGSFAAKQPHGAITARETKEFLSGSDILARIAGAHHGVFINTDAIDRLAADSLGDHTWHTIRQDLARVLYYTLNPESSSDRFPIPQERIQPDVVPVLSGFISVADWIGSSKYFPTCDPMPVAEYQHLSLQRAEEALHATGWLPSLQPASPAEFNQIYPFAPNALQQTTGAIAAAARGPYLLVVEAPMGGGKTEAALYAADCALSRGAARGFYIALPTQATSNAMYKRVKEDYLDKRGYNGRIGLQLVHGNALLTDNEQDIPPERISSEEDSEAGVSAQSWFTARKRSLLAPFGVGTIDQSLLSVLQTKHWFVRLFGLARKVVIFDEVHAYDTYMSTILQRLLRWLGEEGCTVLLLSATLPPTRRQKLIKAYCGKAMPDLPAVNYPRATWVSSQCGDSVTIAVSARERRELHLDYAPTDITALVDRVETALADGGCAAVICNTVRRAQEIYRVLSQIWSEQECECLLFHARTLFGWRADREATVLAKFGKDAVANGKRPYRAIVVATQVIEQSLDLDFDWMATEMAPVDLLLQRAGRVHRHRRDIANPRPAGCTRPSLTVLCDGERHGNPPKFGPAERVPAHEANGHPIYERYVLLRSWLALPDKEPLHLPDDIERMVQLVYEEVSELPVPPDPLWQQALSESRDAMEERRKADRHAAQERMISQPMDAEDLIEQFNARLADDEDPQKHADIQALTRLGSPSVAAVCLCRTEEGLFLPTIAKVAGEAKLVPDRAHGALSLDAEPDKGLMHDLLNATVSVSNKAIFRALVAQEVPPGWRKSPQLRFHRLVQFCDGVAVVNGWRMVLDPILGLVIEKEEE
ncbi:MAG TPA: CRISPR-associated helicase Cas3' [Armatimonadota bacterium]|nr:CRISPR-associated helicase Cas3' [Armatimonadota bacterium]